MRGARGAGPWCWLSAFCAALLLALPASAERYASIVVDAETGRVVSAFDPDAERYPASLTKLMTLYLLFDALDAKRVAMDTELPVSAHAAAQPPTRLGLAPGQTIPVKAAIEALITRSANDVAVVVAEALGGSEPDFAAVMRHKAQTLGMINTAFYNASGLPNPLQHSTARDLAVLARALIRNHAGYYPFFSIEGFEYRGQWQRGHNGMLRRYPGADGLKTGFINASGYNLVASATHNGRRLIGVVLGEENPSARDAQMSRLFDAGFGREPVIATAAVERPPARTEVRAAAPARPAKARLVTVVRGADAPHTRKQAHAKAVRVVRPSAKAKPAHIHQASGDDWGVQIGSYSSRKAAERAAEAARRKVGLKGGNADVRVVATHAGKGKTVYRAQLSSLAQPAATHACRRLAKADLDCIVVRGSGERRLAQAD